MNKVLKEITGKNLFEEDGNLWNKFCIDCDKARNVVVNKSKEINFSKAKETFKKT
ncbi:MAG: hypothetical protein ACLFNO_00730 [Parcubacteria group bacterium]